MAQPPRLDTVLSFGGNDDAVQELEQHVAAEEREDREEDDDDDGAASDSGNSFEFAFARPLEAAGGHPVEAALADDLFAHGRILPAYPVFDRRIFLDASAASASARSSTAPPSPDTYCAWAPRSAPGSPARDHAAFPKSASTGEPARRFRLRDLVSTGGRSHSDGKEKFVFLQPSPPKTSALSAAAEERRPAKKPAPPQTQQQKQAGGKKKAVTEMDMATAHRLFYSKKAGAAGERRRQQQQASYLPYRPGIVGFFAAAQALGRSHHHPY